MGKPLGKKKVAAVLERDGGLCVLRLQGCTVVAQVADHRANRGHGGARSLDEFSNLIAACSLCNGHKETVDGDLRAILEVRGVRVPGASTHAATAVRARETSVVYPDGRVYLLDDSGGRHECT